MTLKTLWSATNMWSPSRNSELQTAFKGTASPGSGLQRASCLTWERGCAGLLLSFAHLSCFPVIPFPRFLNPLELELGVVEGAAMGLTRPV